VAVHEALARANFERDVAFLTDAVAERLRLKVHSRAFPVLDAIIEHSKPLRLRMTADAWNDLPPSIALFKPDGTAWSETLPGGIFNGGPHSVKGGPFICMRGSREYHTHSGHTNDTWDNYRDQDGMELVGILMQLAGAWRKAVR
jgi:hypothetical protein